ncbi:hypothetical protein OOU_Y34scaffold00908g3, partial [Pyricularia oryzae Y34]
TPDNGTRHLTSNIPGRVDTKVIADAKTNEPNTGAVFRNSPVSFHEAMTESGKYAKYKTGYNVNPSDGNAYGMHPNPAKQRSDGQLGTPLPGPATNNGVNRAPVPDIAVNNMASFQHLKPDQAD